MIIFKSASELTAYIKKIKSDGQKIGFVPTMGALHNGHLHLINESKQSTDVTVCSIFVNPTQFNNREDFIKYPITIEKDIHLLLQHDCDILFLPSEAEVYIAEYKIRHYELGELEGLLEGYYRPGHFQGVCQVVDRLLDIVIPDILFLGQKDFQQCMVIQQLVNDRIDSEKIQLNFVPTVREKDGLAMSSRNMRLSEDQRKKAVHIYENLNFVKSHIHLESFSFLEQKAKQNLESQGFIVDYFTISNADTLKKATSLNEPLIALVAASLDSVRLIDNMRLN